MKRVWPLDTALSFDPYYGEPDRDGDTGFELLPDGKVFVRVKAPAASRVVIDRFGTGVILVPEADGSFTVTLDIVVSRQFFAWLSAFGTGAEILSPDSVRQMFREHLQAILKTYE